MDCTIYVAKTKALISFAVTTKLICVFVFAYAKRRFSHDAAHFIVDSSPLTIQRSKWAITNRLMLCFCLLSCD